MKYNEFQAIKIEWGEYDTVGLKAISQSVDLRSDFPPFSREKSRTNNGNDF